MTLQQIHRAALVVALTALGLMMLALACDVVIELARRLL